MKMTGYVDELQWLMMAVADSRRKIGVFISIIFTLVVMSGMLVSWCVAPLAVHPNFRSPSCHTLPP